VIGASRVASNPVTVPGQRPRRLGSEDVSSGTVAFTLAVAIVTRSKGSNQ
jgi:hypothetical protein